MRYILIFFTFVSFLVNGQIIKRTKLEISSIQTVLEANEYLANHSSTMTGQLFELSSRADTADFYQKLISMEKGNIIDFAGDNEKHFFFKTLETRNVKSFRVQYIFLDNKKLTLEKIDSLRRVIFRRLDKGDSFDSLAKEYSIDGNALKGGDLGWFEEGMMNAKFEKSIGSKKTGEIFTVDIPSEKWFYVVRNSHDPRLDKKVTVLYIEVKGGT